MYSYDFDYKGNLGYRLRGVKIYGDVTTGDEVYLENEYSEFTEILDRSPELFRSTLICRSRKGTGGIIVGKKASINACCLLAASSAQTLTMGEGAVLGASAVVTKDFPPYSRVGGGSRKSYRESHGPSHTETHPERIQAGVSPS
jgi:acetyltransferase-like isoleucine patch superfamily enzyme